MTKQYYKKKIIQQNHKYDIKDITLKNIVFILLNLQPVSHIKTFTIFSLLIN